LISGPADWKLRPCVFGAFGCGGHAPNGSNGIENLDFYVFLFLPFGEGKKCFDFAPE